MLNTPPILRPLNAYQSSEALNRTVEFIDLQSTSLEPTLGATEPLEEIAIPGSVASNDEGENSSPYHEVLPWTPAEQDVDISIGQLYRGQYSPANQFLRTAFFLIWVISHNVLT